jgi:hypothetical protein
MEHFVTGKLTKEQIEALDRISKDIDRKREEAKYYRKGVKTSRVQTPRITPKVSKLR